MAAASSSLLVRVLGPVDVVRDGRELPLPGKVRAVAAMLALANGSTVSADRLVDALWGERPPASAANALQVYMSQLRRALADDPAAARRLLETRAPGYRLALTRRSAHNG